MTKKHHLFEQMKKVFQHLFGNQSNKILNLSGIASRQKKILNQNC